MEQTNLHLTSVETLINKNSRNLFSYQIVLTVERLFSPIGTQVSVQVLEDDPPRQERNQLGGLLLPRKAEGRRGLGVRVREVPPQQGLLEGLRLLLSHSTTLQGPGNY